MGTDLAVVLAANVRTLRVATGRTQGEMARLAGIPRATWANVESGTANPTLAVLRSVAMALRIPLEALIAEPPPTVGLRKRSDLPASKRGRAAFLSLFPEATGLAFERMELPPGARTDAASVPRASVECLAIESGPLVVAAGGESLCGDTGDVLIVQGGQRRTYRNAGDTRAVGYVVVFRS